jgi:hypothetical protein
LKCEKSAHGKNDQQDAPQQRLPQKDKKSAASCSNPKKK